MAYKVKQLLDKGLDVSSIDKDLMEDIETIKVLSKDFSKDDSDAMQLDELVYEKLKTSVKQEEATPASTKGKRGRPKGSAKSAPKKKGKRGRPAKQEKAPAKPKMKYKTEPKSDGGVPDCDELLKRWRERRQKAKDMGKKRKTKPVFTKISEGVINAVEKAIKNVPKADIKAQPVRTVKKFEYLRDAADKFLKAFKSVLGEDYVKTEAEKELSDLEGLISSLQEKYVKKYGDGGMMNAEGDEDDMPVIRTQFEEEDFEYAKGGGVGTFKEHKQKKAKELKEKISELNAYLKKLENINSKEAYEESQNLREFKSIYEAQLLHLEDNYANGGGVGSMAGGGTIKQNEGKLFNEKGEMLVYKKQSDTSSIYDVDVYEPRKTDVEEYSKFKYCKREKNGRECVYRLDKKALIEMIKKEKFIYSKGGGVGYDVGDRIIDISYSNGSGEIIKNVDGTLFVIQFDNHKKGDYRNVNIWDIRHEKYAKGGMTEHGLKTGDRIVGKSGKYGAKIYNKQSREAGSVNLNSGKRNVSKYVKGGGVGEEMARGGFVSKGEMVWGKISNSKKMDFLYKNFTPEITPRSQEILVGRAWNFLPKNVKIKFEAKYANVEEY